MRKQMIMSRVRLDHIPIKSQYPYGSIAICSCIIIYWLVIAFHSGQSLYETQNSRLLIDYGAINGQLLGQGDYWRIIVSQFTHVKFPHMLCNVLFIFLAGKYMERYFGTLTFCIVYFLGGITGLYASVYFNPDFVSSGASQALCSLVGFLVIFSPRVWRTSKITGTLLLLFIFIQCFLDMHFSGRLKEGHTFGFIAGVIIGIVYYLIHSKLLTMNQKLPAEM